jgi:hypothetical protein
MTVKIDKGVPIPPRRRLTPAGQDDFAALEVGDSFAVPVPKEFKHKPTIWAGTHRLRNAVYQYGKHSGKKFTVRCMSNEIRVWRIT